MLITGAYDASGHFHWDFFPDTENNGLLCWQSIIYM